MNKTITTGPGKKTALENTKADTFRRQLRLRAQDDGDYNSLIQHLCPHDQEVYFRAKWDGRTLDLTEIPKPAAIEQRVEQPAAQTTKEPTNATQTQKPTDAHGQAPTPATVKDGQGSGAAAEQDRQRPGVSAGAACAAGEGNQRDDSKPADSGAVAVDIELDAILKLEKPTRDAELKTLAPTRGVKWEAKASIETMIERIRKAKK